MSRVLVLLTFLCALTFVACGGDADECGSDSDCKGDRVCEAGACVNPEGNNGGTTQNNGGSGGNNGGTTQNNGGTGGNNGGTTQNNGGTGGNNGSTETNSCCLNGAFYSCPDAASANTCFSDFDPSGCTRDASQDASCGSTGNNGTGNNGTGNNGGGTGGDIGDQCEANSDCNSNSCLVNNGATFGYCTKTCQDVFDCPDFWDCEEVGNASAKYCVDNT